MKLLILILTFLSFSTYAEEPWHMVSFGRDGFGWSSSHENIGASSGSPFKNVVYYFTDIGFNYSYRVSSRLQLGAHYLNTHRVYRLKADSGKRSDVETQEESYGVFATYNFSHDLNDAWYAGYGFSMITFNEENSQDFQNAEGKAPFEFDDRSSIHEIFVGKRFSLRGFNVDNLSYSPQIKVYYKTHGKDFDDNKIGDGTGFNIQPVRFDLLF